MHPEIQRDIAYGSHPLQCFDLHRPAHAAQAPVVFMIHGGGFVMGRKEDFEQQARLFCTEGFVVLNLSHRLVDTDWFSSGRLRQDTIRIPDQLQDLHAALILFRRKAAAWGLSTARLFLAGHSAGAILSLLYLLGEGRHESFRAAGNWAGITDLGQPTEWTAGFLLPWQQMQMQHFFDPLFDYSALAGSLDLRDISAYRLAERHQALPVISIYPEHNFVLGFPGEALLGLMQTKRFHALLRSQQVPERFCLFPGCDHNFQYGSEDAWPRCIRETARFFNSL
ncbi:MAG: alpha/beta hydrolase [Bacteroidetes bacterium]|nr:alpha/beta hydrolase [Bacteroidota bacterium]MBS1629045.1 alpha/beta hydrolase [Bacteroidota bacterium]